jgi:guanosine-3',5'-bis(diphosphate) 3'-pyrophosphohydrolase
MTTLAFTAMRMARSLHENQRRKYTNEPYVAHLGEVAGITASIAHLCPGVTPDVMIATAWLHDCMEDQEINPGQLAGIFGEQVDAGVVLLSDLAKGNRATRNRLTCERLGAAPCWVQAIKCADLISNTASIVTHDPKFAKVYLEEKRELLKWMNRAPIPVWELAVDLAHQKIPAAA